MTNLIISVDLDGVVYDFCGQFRNYLHLRDGKPLDEMPPPTVWDFWEQWRLSKDEFVARFREFGATSGFARGEPMPDAVKTLHQLTDEGHHVRIVTARGCEGRTLDPYYKCSVTASTIAWLYEHNIPYSDLYFTNAKADVVADVFIDDAHHHLTAIRAAGKRGICFDAPYNQDWTGERVRSWTEFYELLRRYESSITAQ